MLIRLKANDASLLNYKPGDHIAVFPTNQEYLITDVLKKLNLSGVSATENIQIEQFKGNKNMYFKLPDIIIWKLLN